MVIIASIITGNSSATICAAIRSVVDLVDRVLVVDTGITDDTMTLAREAAGEKLLTSHFPWRNDFAAARNHCLNVCRANGDWYLMVDSDETYRGTLDRSLLADSPDVHCWMIPDDSGCYFRERLIRADSPARWTGKTHEALIGLAENQKNKLISLGVSSSPKTPKQFREKLQRDLAALQIETAERANDPRWWYYLGQTLEGLQEFKEAIAAYATCISIPGWSEQRAWACFRSAICRAELRDFAGALKACTIGLENDARFPELAWYAGWNCYQLARYAEAATWANVALAITASGQCYDRIGFRHPFGWEEGPKNLLKWATNKSFNGKP